MDVICQIDSRCRHITYQETYADIVKIEENQGRQIWTSEFDIFWTYADMGNAL